MDKLFVVVNHTKREMLSPYGLGEGRTLAAISLLLRWGADSVEILDVASAREGLLPSEGVPGYKDISHLVVQQVNDLVDEGFDRYLQRLGSETRKVESDRSSVAPLRSGTAMIARVYQTKGKEVTLVCDGNCEKAWGTSGRPSQGLYLADEELGTAPGPGKTAIIMAGLDMKPSATHGKPELINRWCAEECERCVVFAGSPPRFSKPSDGEIVKERIRGIVSARYTRAPNVVQDILDEIDRS